MDRYEIAFRRRLNVEDPPDDSVLSLLVAPRAGTNNFFVDGDDATEIDGYGLLAEDGSGDIGGLCRLLCVGVGPGDR